MDTCQQLREKCLVAKKALSYFLDSSARAESDFARADSAVARADSAFVCPDSDVASADSDVASAGLVQDGEEYVEETPYEENNNNKDEEKVSVSVTVSSVSESNDAEPHVVSVKKRKDTSARRKCFLQQEEHKHYNTRGEIAGDVREEEVTSFRTLRRRQRWPVKG